MKYLAFFITFCSVVGLAKTVTLTNNIVYKKSAQRKYICPGSYKKIQGRNPEIISLVFWKKLSFHNFKIKYLTDL
jgi:hypothetical protein